MRLPTRILFRNRAPRPDRLWMVLLIGPGLVSLGCQQSPAPVVTAASSTPPLVIEPPVGKAIRTSLQQDARTRLSFTLTNPGTTPIQITGLKADCSCVDSRLSANVIPPRQKVTLTAEVNVSVGRSSRSELVLTTDSAAVPVQRIPILLEGPELAVPRISSLPSHVRLNCTAVDEVATGTLEVVTWEPAGAEPWIIGFDSDNRRIWAEEIERTTAPIDPATVRCRTQFRVHGTLPSDDVTEIESFLQLRFREAAPSYAPPCQVRLSLVSPIGLAPSTVLLEPSRSSKEGRVSVTHSDGNPISVRLLPLETKVPLQIDLDPANEGATEWTIRIRSRNQSPLASPQATTWNVPLAIDYEGMTVTKALRVVVVAPRGSDPDRR